MAHFLPDMTSAASVIVTLLSAASVVAAGPLSEHPLRYQVQEEVPIGTRVGNVAYDAEIRRRFSKDVLPQLEFRFLSEPAVPLVIGLTDGVIRTSGPIDREAIPGCRQRETCEIPVDVTVQPVTFFVIIKLVIEVVDVNDHSPRFVLSPSSSSDIPSSSAHQTSATSPTSSSPPQSTIISVLESVAVGSTFLLPSATDPDSPTFGVRHYDIVSSTNKFGLRVTEKLDGFLDVRLLLRERLDRELVDEYRLRLVAVDGGQPPRTASINVTVRVLDANDNDPVFDRLTYETTIVENELPLDKNGLPRPIVRVRATDADLNDNGRVIYDFASQTRTQHGRTFSIDNRTGEIFLRHPVDRERSFASGTGGSAMTGYRLIVTAEDAGPDSHPVDATVLVAVADVNDNAPTVVVNTLAAVGTDRASVPENTSPRTFVAHVTVADRDAGANGTVECQLQVATAASGSTAAMTLDTTDPSFVLEERSLLHQSETEYQILTGSTFDRESIAAYELSVSCRDHGDPPLTTVRKLPVLVTDENDNQPTFSRSVYTSLVTENNPPGSSIIQVTASDMDALENGTIARYVIVGSAESRLFSIDGRGVIIAREALDREDADIRRFHVLAVDAGRPPKTGTALVVVNVEDVDDQLPTFAPVAYRFSVPENQPSWTPIGVVTAHDADLAPNNDFRFTFASDNSATDCFWIDPSNGTLKTRCSLDRELQPVYYLNVVAIPKLQRFGSDSSGSTWELPQKSSSVIGSSGTSSTASVVVFVTDLNDNAPSFVFPSTPNNDTVSLSSSAPPGHVFTRLLARDSDDDLNARLAFRLADVHELHSPSSSASYDHNGSGRVRIVGQPPTTSSQPIVGNGSRTGSGDESAVDGTPWFSVDPVLGTIAVARSLAGIEHRVFRLRVIVYDSAPYNSLSSTAHLNVIVNRTIPYVPQYSVSNPSSSSSFAGIDRSRSPGSHFRSGGKTMYAVGFGASVVFIVVLVVLIVVLCSRRRSDGNQGRKHQCCCCCGNSCRTKRRRNAQERYLVGKSGCVEVGNGKDIDVLDSIVGTVEGVKMLPENAGTNTGSNAGEVGCASSVECTPMRRSVLLGFKAGCSNELNINEDGKHEAGSSINNNGNPGYQASVRQANENLSSNNQENATLGRQQHATSSDEGPPMRVDSLESAALDEYRYSVTMPRQQRVHPTPTTIANDGVEPTSNNSTADMTPWQPRSQTASQSSTLTGVSYMTRPASTCFASRRPTSARCSYGVSSPCSKLHPVGSSSHSASTPTAPSAVTSSTTTRTVHFRNQPSQPMQHRHAMTLPRNHLISRQSSTASSSDAPNGIGATPPPPPPPPIRRTTVSFDCVGEAASRLKPPPPPSTTTGNRTDGGVDTATGYRMRQQPQRSNGLHGTTVGNIPGRAPFNIPTAGQAGAGQRQVPVSTIIV